MPEEDNAPIAHELEVSTSEGGGLRLPPFSLARAFGTMQEVINWFGSQVSGGYMRVLLLVLCVSSLDSFWVASAYEEVSVLNGGTISGKVTITEGKPIPKGFNLITFPDPVYCGRISTGTGWRILNEFTVAKDGALKDTVVALMRVEKGKPFKFEAPTIEARDCRFLPFVSVVKNGAEVRVVNMDPVFHDIPGV